MPTALALIVAMVAGGFLALGGAAFARRWPREPPFP
jgi:uncharacterized protein involved in exopolysaccharide biosynthesis